MTTFLTSDPHFFHTNVIKYCNRPYETVEEMNEDLIRRWNKVVGPQDTVYCIGDFSFAIRPVELYTRRLNGYKILVSGNHDWTHPSHKKSRNPEKAKIIHDLYIQHGWDEVHTHTVESYKGNLYNLSHLPYRGDTTDDRKFERHRLEDEGITLLCGHVHQHWQTKRTEKGTLMINVGVDVHNLAPISFEEVYQLEQKANA